MAYCDRCGKEIRDGAKLCDTCGVSDDENTSLSPPVAGGILSEQEKTDWGKRKKKLPLILGVVVLLFVIGVGILWRKVHLYMYQKKAPVGYVYIPSGQFMMGCSQGDEKCSDDEKPAHHVRITKGFYIKTTEVTQGEYKSVMGNNPSEFTNCGDECPVEQVRWYYAKEYCEKTGGRLPTEAEWEYAARGGTTTRYYWGDRMDGDYAWYDDNTDSTIHPVEKKKPNAYGLYDMIGNVWEWVEDCYDEGWYGKMPARDPLNTSTGCGLRVIRGGAWSNYDSGVRVSIRSGNIYYFGGGNNFGFRCAQD